MNQDFTDSSRTDYAHAHINDTVRARLALRLNAKQEVGNYHRSHIIVHLNTGSSRSFCSNDPNISPVSALLFPLWHVNVASFFILFN